MKEFLKNAKQDTKSWFGLQIKMAYPGTENDGWATIHLKRLSYSIGFFLIILAVFWKPYLGVGYYLMCVSIPLVLMYTVKSEEYSFSKGFGYFLMLMLWGGIMWSQ